MVDCLALSKVLTAVMESTPVQSVVRFAAFEVDLRTRELRKRGLRVRLPDQPFRVLELLLKRPGEIVAREELQRQIWPADTFVGGFQRSRPTPVAAA